MCEHRSTGQKLLRGFGAGFLATLPMTLWMLSANRVLPAAKPDPLPPEEITVNLLRKAEMDQALNGAQQKQASLVNHFVYGGLLTMPFGFFRPKNRQRRNLVTQGALYGLLVWVSNYLGLLPTVRLYPPATQEPARMNSIMIVAHLCWGASVGWMIAQEN
jgi:uncharacterized membrane protein YagU involved in acid resistance